MDNKNIYIMSLEGSDIYSHIYREQNIIKKYCGMIPYSLELVKLEKEGLKVKNIKNRDKYISDDIINVKFNYKVKGVKEIIKDTKKKINKINTSKIKMSKDRFYEIFEMIRDYDKKEQQKSLNKILSKKELRAYNNEIYKNKLINYIIILQKRVRSISKLIISKSFKVRKGNNKKYAIVSTKIKWQEIKADDIRTLLYEKGFTLSNIDSKTGEIISTEYVVWKRSSSKSRTGQVLFIKKELKENMTTWARMNLPIKEDSKIDYPSLLAYESLVGSALEGLVKIPISKMLIIDDVWSVFDKKCNVIKKNDTTKHLCSVVDTIKLKNCLFDGESLLSSEHGYFPEDQSMLLLRNHKFKSAAFACDIQLFLRTNCPEGIDYDDWQIEDKFGNLVYANDIHFIFTPSSLKALKFSNLLGLDEDMYNHWKDTVQSEGEIFGICKHEKESKRGTDSDGNILQQTSYQMINSMPFSAEDITQITTFEREYIEKLKNDDDTFIKYIESTANITNSNMMWVDLYKRNKNVVNTELFKDFRATRINKYLERVKSGKVRLIGDYAIMLGNPLEYLQHAIGKLYLDNIDPDKTLTGNQIYTKLFDFDKELVSFRNPHTSPSNVLVVRNKYVADIETYFGKLTKNIVCVNSIGFALPQILSGADFDSDSIVIFDTNNKLLEVAQRCYDKYYICENKVDCDTTEYKITNTDMAIIDNKLSKSKSLIGEVVNLAQLCMSIYWDMINKGKNAADLDYLLENINILTILSGISIDLAKKMYKIDIEDEIEYIKSTSKLPKFKPLFWKTVSQKNAVSVRKYNCPMDMLIYEMSKIKPAEDKSLIGFHTLLIDRSSSKDDRKQKQKVLDYVEKMVGELNGLYAQYMNVTDKAEKKEKNILEEDIVKDYSSYVKKLKINELTMYSILWDMSQKDIEFCTKLLNILYITQKEVFINAFKSAE